MARYAGVVFLVAWLVAVPRAQSTSWRPTLVAEHGMVAAGHPLAAEAGLRILKAGGNAVDAAIATWAVQGEVEPGMTGLGADMFVMIYLAKTGEVKFINGSGFAPAAATIDFYTRKGGIPDSGPLSIAVPGAVGGAALAVQKYGTRPLTEVFAPAIEIAESGFPITEALGTQLSESRDKLARYPSTTKIWFKDGKPLEMGDVLVNKDLARTLCARWATTARRTCTRSPKRSNCRSRIATPSSAIRSSPPTCRSRGCCRRSTLPSGGARSIRITRSWGSRRPETRAA
jgi:hypothetical protein